MTDKEVLLIICYLLSFLLHIVFAEIMEHRFGSTFFLFLFSCNATDHGFLLCSAVFQIIQSIRMTWWPPLSACSRPMTTASLDTSIGPWLKPSKKENVPQYKHVLLMQTSLVLSLYRLSFFFDDKFTSVEKNCLDYQYVDNWLLRVITSAISPPPFFLSFFGMQTVRWGVF